MDYKVLYRKYRPLTFDDVTGQETVVKTLKNAIINNKISHAYIFTGPRGTGKTSLAKIFARSINCEHNDNGNPCLECFNCKNFNENPDIIEIDAASNNGVDEIRELINNIKLAPSNSKYKVYIIDEVHMLSQSAFNALLLTLEEPPSHVVFILATTDIQNVPITILSRTQRFDFTRIALEDIKKRLAYVCSCEKIDITEEALEEIAIQAEGGLRDALSILDQLSSIKEEKITIDTILETYGTISKKKIEEFYDNLENNNINKVLTLLKEFKNSSIDSKVFINKFIYYLKDRAVDIKIGNASEKRLSFNDIKKLILELNNIITNKMISIDPYVIIEMIVLSFMENSLELNKSTGNSNETNFPGNKIEEKKVIKKEKDENLENTKEKKLKKEATNDDQFIEFQKIRINNTLVGANKQKLAQVKQMWKKYIEDIKKINKDIYLNICDTQIVVASNEYFIICSLSDSSANLINKMILNVEKEYNKDKDNKYKIIAVSEQTWQEIKKKYIDDLKNHKKYELMDEIKLQKEKKEEIEDIANDIFDIDKIEIVKE